MSSNFLINTGLQPGARATSESRNRLNGFSAVTILDTRLKPGANETFALCSLCNETETK